MQESPSFASPLSTPAPVPFDEPAPFAAPEAAREWESERELRRPEERDRERDRGRGRGQEREQEREPGRDAARQHARASVATFSSYGDAASVATASTLPPSYRTRRSAGPADLAEHPLPPWPAEGVRPLPLPLHGADSYDAGGGGVGRPGWEGTRGREIAAALRAEGWDEASAGRSRSQSQSRAREQQGDRETEGEKRARARPAGPPRRSRDGGVRLEGGPLGKLENMAFESPNYAAAR